MSRAAKQVLDDEVKASEPSLEQMYEYWYPMLTAQSKKLELENTARKDHTLLWTAAPVTCPEITDTEIPMSPAAGVDGVSARQWRSIPVRVRALFYNTVLAVGEFPAELLLSRTVFVPKKDGSSTPPEFRPICVASVIVRQLHKIFAVRLVKANLIKERQRALHDGCAENTIFLDTALHVARGSVKELHAVSLDVSKAFDSVSHYAIRSALRGRWLPEALVQYMSRMYENSGTMLEVGRIRSSPIRVSRGVRQGVGTNAKLGMKSLLQIAEEEATKYCLSFNPSKSQAILMMIAGKVRKYKVLTEPQFTLNSGPINQLGSTDAFRYLGLSISPRGIAKPTGYIKSELVRITNAPVRPQQRLKILRCFLIPRLYHQLVLSRTPMRMLRAIDKQVRVAVRKWLCLPKDTPLGYFHASCIDGGLRIPALKTASPGHIFTRFASLTESTSPLIRDVVDHPYNVSLIRWARAMLTRNAKALLRQEDRQRHWATRLHRSSDGAELREAAAVPASRKVVALENKLFRPALPRQKTFAAVAQGLSAKQLSQQQPLVAKLTPKPKRTSNRRRESGKEKFSATIRSNGTQVPKTGEAIKAELVKVVDAVQAGIRFDVIRKVTDSVVVENSKSNLEKLLTSLKLQEHGLTASKRDVSVSWPRLSIFDLPNSFSEDTTL
ncbi:unnamed protein product [Trichogramma brassicae]|uniref:Reverse transcriptase domain-containing protein n=1 Tax=Trichogramma brassicae TaxID=86971 RepID=A0A6H5IC58_9HYME|nr:unnamed protein product [Trichogramma brassicae]